MISNDTYMLEATSRHEMAALLRCRVEELNAALPNLKDSCLGDVTLSNNGGVTLTSRRLQREWLARENGRLRAARFRKKRPRNADVTSVSVSGSLSSSSEGNGGPGERDAELPRGFPTTPDDAIAQCAMIGADAVFITSLWNGAMARNGMDGAGQVIRSWQHYVAKHWPKEQAKRFETEQAAVKPDFWKNKSELELIEKELKSIRGRATQTSTGILIQPKDKPNFERLRARRDELKKMLGLWQM